MTIRTRGTLPFCAATVVVTLAAASLSIEHPYGAQAVAVDRGSRDYTLPDQMQWRDTANGKTANLFGDPSKPGLYAYILKRGPNVWSKPHFHDNDRFVTVLEGTVPGGHRKVRSGTHRAIEGRLVRQRRRRRHSLRRDQRRRCDAVFRGHRAGAKPSGRAEHDHRIR